MPERRLAAILAADAVGFSDRAAADEAGALRAVAAALGVLETVIALNGGRVVKTMGDGLLAEFSSVVNAVSAAAAIQDRLAERGRDLPAEALFAFRIGVHVGDVVAVEGDVFGEGVNIAARLEACAGPSEVLVSARVVDHVEGKLDLRFEDRGERALKGALRPVRIFAIRGGDGPAPARAAPERPTRPSIAVLPFVNLSSDPEQDYFADGLTEDLITALASAPGLFVIARNSSFVYKGAAVDVRKVGRDLGVRYVLEGSVRRAGDRLRVTGQLVDADTGAHLWAEHMDGEIADVFALQDRVTEAVVAAIGPEIEGAEISRAVAKRPESLTAYDFMLRAMAALNRAQVLEAIVLLDQAIARAPGYGKALALRAWCNTIRSTWSGEGERAENVPEGIALARRALDAAPGDPEVEAFAGYTFGFMGEDLTNALGLLHRSVARCPSLGWAWVSVALLEGLRGDPRRALEACAQAERLSPKDPMAFRLHSARAVAGWALGDWESVLKDARLVLASVPGLAYVRALQVIALAELGQMDEARTVAARLLDRFPDFRFVDNAARLRRFEAVRGAPLDAWNRRLKEIGLP
jgi:adenylate cyclase